MQSHILRVNRMKPRILYTYNHQSHHTRVSPFNTPQSSAGNIKMAPDRSALMARMSPSISQITSHLYLGNASSSLNCEVLKSHNITAMVSLLERRYEWWSRPENRAVVPQERHLFVPCQDTSTMDILAHLGDICDFIDEQLRLPAEVVPTEGNDSTTGTAPGDTKGGNVLIHCELGISRSPAIVIAYLMKRQRKGLDAALSTVNRERAVKPSENFREQLRLWETMGFQVWEDKERRVPKAAYQEYLDKDAGQG